MSKEFEPSFSVKEFEVKAEEMAFYKVMAESSCLVYQLTKIPLIRRSTSFFDSNGGLSNITPEVFFRETLLNGANYLHLETPQLTEKDSQPWREACEIRNILFCEALAERLRRKGSLSQAWQSEEWAWQKVKGEEVWELLEEVAEFQKLLKTKDSTLSFQAEKLRDLAESESENVEEWLWAVFSLTDHLGLTDKRNLFLFMKEKQEGRIALGKSYLTKEDKEKEWERLIPVLQKYFTNRLDSVSLRN